MEQGPEKFDKSAAVSLAIDGSRIKSIREGKKLTQLYVASVVGVTTDTISRWENNRYPSIKRDNAEKLARALEVELSEIVRPEPAGEAPDLAATAPPRGIRLWPVAALVVIVVMLLTATLLTRRPAAPPTAVRWTPRFAAPGEIIPVQIKVTRRQDEMSGFILKEKLPKGFQMFSSLPASSATDPSRSAVKWLVPGGSSSVVISYSIKVPAGEPAGKEARISGEVVVRKGGTTRTEAVGGSDTIRIGSYHWADLNGDGRIDDDEIMPAYYICEAMKDLGLDWKTIEAIWSGKGYRWDARTGFTVIK